MSDNEMRAEFEAWLNPEYPQESWSTSRYLDDDGSDQYFEDFVQGAWVVWQARPALTDEQVREIADHDLQWLIEKAEAHAKMLRETYDYSRENDVIQWRIDAIREAIGMGERG